MDQEVVIRPFAEGDEEGIVALLQAVFEGWPRFDLECQPLDHWRWKYEDNPLRRKVVAIAEYDHKIVGCSHGFYLRAKVGQRSLIAQQGTDLAVNPDFRGRGLHPNLIELKNKLHKANGANLTYALSSNPVVIRKDLRENRPHFPSQIKHMIKIKDVAKHFSNNPSEDEAIKKYGYTALKTLNQISSQIEFPRKNPNSRFEIATASEIGDEAGYFWDEVKDEYNFIVERDKNYMNWRYNDERGGKYSVRYATEGGRVLGYVALRVNRIKEDYPEGYIVDLLTLPQMEDVAEALIRDADYYFTERGVNIIHTISVNGHPNDRLLERDGFIYDRENLILFYTPLDVGEEFNALTSSPPSKLHFTYGDLDWI